MKKAIELFKVMYKNPRGRAVLFFAFYFVVFFVLIASLRYSASHNKNRNTEYEMGNKYSFNSASFQSENYHFKYIIKLDDKEYVYEGDRNKDIELFSFNNKEYYKEGNDYFVKDKVWVKCDSPYVYDGFIDTNNIVTMIKSSTYESKTSYESGVNKYNFLISSNTVNKIISNKDTDIDEIPNNIIISTDEKNIVNEIDYKLDSYCTNNKLCKKSLDIELDYEEYGEEKKIDSPIK